MIVPVALIKYVRPDADNHALVDYHMDVTQAKLGAVISVGLTILFIHFAKMHLSTPIGIVNETKVSPSKMHNKCCKIPNPYIA